MAQGDRPGRRVHESHDARERVRREVEAEIRHHLACRVEELMAGGMDRAEAEAEAARSFGDLDRTLDYCTRESLRTGMRERWARHWDRARQDVIQAARSLGRSPAYGLVVVVTLAAGVAARTIVFSLMNPYFIRELPFPEPTELVQLGGVDPREGWDGGRFSVPQITELADRSRALEDLGAYRYGTANLTGRGDPSREQVAWLSGNLMGILGATPLLGRTLLGEDGGPDADPVVVVGEDLWDRRLGRDPDILGSTLQLDGRTRRIVGVMPRSFTFPFGGLHLWLPLEDTPSGTPRNAMTTLPVGRLGAGWTKEAAAVELSDIHGEMAVQYPEADGRYSSVSVKPLREALNFAWDILRTALFLLLGAVGMLLVLACVNVASLTLARSTVRAREVAVRSALGAGRSRIVGQLLAEGILLALAGGALGTGLAYLATGTLNDILPPDLFRVGDVSVDGRVLAFSALVSLSTPLVFGLAPALSLTRRPVASVLRSVRTGDDTRTLRGRRILVVAQVALAVILVTGTGLMTRSLARVSAVDLGFHADRVLGVTLTPGSDEYPGREEVEAYFALASARLQAIPGVETVGSGSYLPLNHETAVIRYQAPNGGSAPEEWPTALTSAAGPDYFAAMGIPLLAGRAFTAGDEADREGVIISRTLADRLFPGVDPVGRSLLHASGGETVTGRVLGVVGDVRFQDLTSPVRPHLYRPMEGSGHRRRFLLVRATGDPAALTPAVRAALRNLDPAVVPDLRPATDVVRENTLLWTVSAAFLGAFGVVALLLASLGIYGLVAFSVARRRAELGLRMALGADGGRLQRGVMLDALRLTGMGAALGLLLALGLAGLARNVLFGVSALDPVTTVGVVGIFTIVALCASALPAWRARRADPLEALRAE